MGKKEGREFYEGALASRFQAAHVLQLFSCSIRKHISCFLTRAKWTCSPDSCILTRLPDQWQCSSLVEVLSLASPGPLAFLGVDSYAAPGLYRLTQALALCSNLTPNVSRSTASLWHSHVLFLTKSLSPNTQPFSLFESLASFRTQLLSHSA